MGTKFNGMNLIVLYPS